ncbi:receptor-type tyrosine-protein phosphatase F-like [Bacillus rossius redtenbacheri]|uniref:receptor-type tyrosine-protein phosphatase F-like n=1 Tax=Bacillus rossius redtenbacheri TaxID=93214 RepID=UPI002FDCD603
MASGRGCARLWLLPLAVAGWLGVAGVVASECQAGYGVENLQVPAVGPGWALLQWQHSPLTAQCVDSYTVSSCALPSRWSPHCGPEYSESLPVAAASHNVTGLQACAFHRVAVTAEGKDGSSAPVADVIVTPSEGLGPVQNLDVSVADEHLAVIWDAPVDSEACTAGYQVCWSPPGDPGTCSWTQLNLWVSGEDVAVHPCTLYNVSVRAVDVSNTTSPEATTLYHAGADRVRNLTASEVTPHSFLVSWDPSPASVSCLEGHTVAWCSVDHRSGLCLEPVAALNLTAGVTQYNVTGLRPCHQHHVTVTARSSDGSESTAVSVDVKTSLAELLPPQNVSVRVLNSGLVFVYFSPAEDSGLCTANYTGCLRDVDRPSAPPVCQPAPSDQYWATWDNRTRPCGHYVLRLTATGANTTASTDVAFTAGVQEATRLRVTNMTSNSSRAAVKLSWQVSSLNKCVQYQLVTVTAQGRNWRSTHNVSSSVTELVLEDLDTCARYEVGVEQVAARYSATSSLDFHSGSNVTSARGLAAVGSAPDSVAVWFEAPAVSPACVANYSVCWRALAGGRRWCVERARSGGSTVLIHQLRPCTNYTVLVTPLGPDRQPYSTSSVVAATSCPSCAAALSTVNIVTWVITVCTAKYVLASQQ